MSEKVNVVSEKTLEILMESIYMILSEEKFENEMKEST